MGDQSAPSPSHLPNDSLRLACPPPLIWLRFRFNRSLEVISVLGTGIDPSIDSYAYHPVERVIVSKERHNERATSRKSDKSKTVSKERQEHCQFELKLVFLMTKLTLILILNDPYDA